MSAYPSSDLFKPHLFTGERILWTGQPKRGFVLRPSDAFLVPFSLLWTGMVVWMFVQTMNMPAGGGPDIVLILFLLFGLYFTFGRFIHDAVLRSRLSYAVTDQRILVLRGSRPSKVVSLDVRHLPKLELTQYRDGTGTIVFETQNWFPGWGGTNAFNLWVPSLNGSAQLFRIYDPRKAYELIRNQAHSPP